MSDRVDVQGLLNEKNYEIKKDFSDMNNAALEVYIIDFQENRATVTEKWSLAQAAELEELVAEVKLAGTDDPDDLADFLEEQVNFIDEQLKTALYEKQRRNLQGGEDSELKGNCDKLGKEYVES